MSPKNELQHAVMKLQPEFYNAFMKFRNLFNLASQPCPVTSELWINKQFSICNNTVAIKAIPSPKEWKWSQSKAKVTLQLFDNCRVTIRKLIPRRNHSTINTAKMPSYKLWEYRVVSQSLPTRTAFWCERGRSVISSDDLRIEDYQFLAEFMEPEVAAIFWPSLVNKLEI